MNHIEEFANEHNPFRIWPDATIIYLTSILRSVADFIEPCNTYDELATVIKEKFPDELVKYTFDAIGQYHGDIELAKAGVIEYLVAEICDLALDGDTRFFDPVIFPWDVQHGMSQDKDLSKLFGMPSNITTFAVTIEIAAKEPITTTMTMEYFVGLLLAASVTELKVSIFGIYVDVTQFIVEASRFKDRSYGQYRMKMGDVEYHFDSMGFMYGFKKGCDYAASDHRSHYTDLIRWDGDSDRAVPISF